MTDDQVQRKLNQLTKIANELQDEAKRRYGAEALMFYEAEGVFIMMAHDCGGSSRDRRKGVRFFSHGYCQMGCGAW
jgi:hypothetical protein